MIDNYFVNFKKANQPEAHLCLYYPHCYRIMVFNTTFNNISV